MTQQHDAPEGGAGNRVDLGSAKYDLGRKLNAIVSVAKTWEDAAEYAAALFAPTPPAPSGLVDAVWDPWVDTRLVRFDATVVWGEGGFDFDAWESLRWEMHYPGAGSYAVWPNGSHGKAKRWSFYGGPDGVLALERFTSEADAKSETEAYALSIAATRATLDATLSGQQGGAVPAGEVTAQDLLDALNAKPGISFVATIKDVQDVLWELRRARLAEQPAPVETGADGVEELRKAAQDVVDEAADTDKRTWEGYSVLGISRIRIVALRTALDASSSEEGR